MIRSTHLRLVVALVIVAVASIVGARPVAAHTAFDSSTPSEGSVVAEPVSLVSISFTNPATPVGDEFVALTPAGVTQLPVDVQTLDDKLFTLRFDPPLSGGQVGIRWSVRAGDAHPIEGAFAFTVDAPAPTTVPTTAAPPTTVAVTVASDPSEAAAATTAPLSQASTNEAGGIADEDVDTAAVVPDPAAADSGGAVDSAPDAAAADPAPAAAQSLDEFLAVDNSRPGETTATMGRVISFLGVTLALGGLAFVATVLRGRRGEIDRGIAAVRLLGGLIIVGALVEYVGVARIAGESFGAAWSSAPGFATVLRLLGGAGLLIGLAATIAGGQASAARSLSAAVIEDATGEHQRHDGGRPAALRWIPTAASWPAFAGVGLIIASFWFDGHTVSKGFRPLHAVVNSVHLIAGSVWVGGVVAMAAVAWSRHRSGRSTGAAAMVVRFSKIATIALASVIVAGLVMAVFVLDSFSELTGTPWGKILLLKTGAVSLAAVGGAYNHFRLRPALESNPDSPELQSELRSTLTAEAIMLVFVVIVTAWLVAAAS